jgi:hypothetical protein
MTPSSGSGTRETVNPEFCICEAGRERWVFFPNRANVFEAHLRKAQCTF